MQKHDFNCIPFPVAADQPAVARQYRTQ